jgi:hypothetical protein
MPKSKQKAFAKSKAIFNLIFPAEKIKTEAKIKKPTLIAILFLILLLLLCFSQT